LINTELALATKMADDADEVTRFLQDIATHAKPIAVKEVTELNEFATADTWHKDVLTFDIFNEKSELIGQFYSDLYAREGKRSGAWMGVCRHRLNTSSKRALPVAFLTCNFTPAGKDKPALLTHDEVETLFHEFGHTLISAHYETNEPLPNSLLKQMLAAKHFQTGMQTVRQLEFSLFDISLHKQDNQSDKSPSVQDVLNTARKDVSVIQAPDYNRFQCSFSHIFAGGYAAGYYSYKWAEVLSADAFDEFEQHGIFNESTGQKFLKCILSVGGVPTAATMFKDFKGRAPSITALLKSTGLA